MTPPPSDVPARWLSDSSDTCPFVLAAWEHAQGDEDLCILWFFFSSMSNGLDSFVLFAWCVHEYMRWCQVFHQLQWEPSWASTENGMCVYVFVCVCLCVCWTLGFRIFEQKVIPIRFCEEFHPEEENGETWTIIFISNLVRSNIKYFCWQRKFK